ncbi:cysteine protease StiP domain-containing protein, partial [Clostridium sp. UBA5119]|uniref:cysteine protease StiP domain-containing protein n=1 Tax=Clostridium sp. UBA5119 TaxID=1946366 RepID=UPI003216DF2A
MNFVRHSYGDECELLLKDLTGIIKEITVEEKEELIRSGVNYSEFISKEDVPSESMKKIFFSMLKWSKRKIATYV